MNAPFTSPHIAALAADLDREDAFADFLEWQHEIPRCYSQREFDRECERREFTDFDDWFERIWPSRRDTYRRAS